MADVAQLGIKIDSDPVAEATTRLDKFVPSAQKAATATKTLNDNFKTAGTEIKKATQTVDEHGKKINQSSDEHKKHTESTRQLREQFRAFTEILNLTGSQLGVASSGTGQLAVGMLRLGPVIGGVAAGLALVAGAAVAALKAMQSVNEVAAAGKFAGLSSNFTQGLVGAGGTQGLGVAEMVTAINAFGQSVRDAQQGVGTLAQLFRANNVAVGDTEETLIKVNTLVRNAASEQEKFTLLTQAGLPATRQWAELMSMSGPAFRALIDSMPKLTAEQLKQAQDVEDRWNALITSITLTMKTGLVAAADAFLGKMKDTGPVTQKSLTDAVTQLSRQRGNTPFTALTPNQIVSQNFPTATMPSFGVPLPARRPEPVTVNPQDLVDAMQKENQRISLLGDLATATDKAKQKQNELNIANLQGVGVTEKNVELLTRQATVMQQGADLAKKAADNIVTADEFIIQKQNELQIQVDAGKKTQEEMNLAMEAYKRHAQDAAEATQVYASKFPELTRNILDSVNVNKQLDQLGVKTINNLADGLTDIVTGTKTVSQAFNDMAKAILRDLTNMIIKQLLFRSLSSVFPGLTGSGVGAAGAGTGFSAYTFGGQAVPVATALGGVFAGPGIGAFSSQVVSRPTVFPFARGIGLMGEAGPEAVMPLRRGADGSLGVTAKASPANVVVNNFSSNDNTVRTRQEEGQDGPTLIIDIVKKAQAKGEFDKGNAGLYALRRRKVY